MFKIVNYSKVFKRRGIIKQEEKESLSQKCRNFERFFRLKDEDKIALISRVEHSAAALSYLVSKLKIHISCALKRTTLTQQVATKTARL